MSSATGSRLLTVEEFARLCADERCELVDGRVVKMSPAGKRQPLTFGSINGLLSAHVLRTGFGGVVLGETACRVAADPDRVRVADLAVASHELLADVRRSPETFFARAPELVVEIVSPDDPMDELDARVQDFLGAGARAVWVVSPATRKVYVHCAGAQGRILGPADEIDGGDALPGFRARVADFFVHLP